ncbi:cGMP-dependent 3',5'-cyclic phosphodiesterase [Agrilus planipennis]|uniref:Phosphodiesterase n=1 Tax=Agrilus planipennis TaxID=224129 RepID=A0A1W4W5Z9_AGRPL|nr:cGMP-dependent 3',5'-cyclic phosphodiesterase [Agrilus planipennis]
MDECTPFKVTRRPVPNLLPPPPYCRKSDPPRYDPDQPPTIILEANDPGAILNLCESLHDGNTQALEFKINKYLKEETLSKCVFLIWIHYDSQEGIVQVIGKEYLETIIRIPLSHPMFKEVMLTKETILSNTKFLEYFLQQNVEKINKKKEADIFIVPVFEKGINESNPRKIALLTCLVRCKRDEYIVTALVHEVFRYCLTIMMNTASSEEEARLKRQCQSLLMVARKLFSHLGNINELLREIMTEARRITNSERCSLFLLDPDHMHLVAKVFDGHKADEISKEVKIAKDQGIAGHVAATGKILNIKDAYKHPLFYKGVDKCTGFRTRNILCFPIKDDRGIIGVAELCNKMGGDYDCFDEEVAMAFSIYCGLSIMHSLVYKKIQDAQMRSKLSNELMIYHMKVNACDVINVLICGKSHHHPRYLEFRFSPREIPYGETVCFVVKMYEDLNLINAFRIKKDLLVRFLLLVQKAYRDPPYHNWTHAFSTAHFSYLCIKNFDLLEKNYLTDLEALALITSCLCHDIDHRGTTNSFQIQSNSLLASLYSSEGSVMEHHHLSQTLCILNTTDCNFIESLEQSDYVKCLDLIRDLILATDLATHFDLLPKQQEMAERGIDLESDKDKSLFLSLLMTASDLSDQTKECGVVRSVAELIYTEFFTQGDMEKNMGRKPMEMMDREKASIADSQVDFLEHVCVPVFTVLANLFPGASVLLETMEANTEYWEVSKQVFGKYALEGKTSLEVLTMAGFNAEVFEAIKKKNEPEVEEEEEEEEEQV